MKVMLVDDSRTIRAILRNALRELGHEDVVEAADGVEALAALAKGPVDLMIVDWNMPNMDGITLVKKVRETDKSTPIFMCTTEAEKTRVIAAIQAGANDYVVKPFTPELLKKKLGRFAGAPAAG